MPSAKRRNSGFCRSRHEFRGLLSVSRAQSFRRAGYLKNICPAIVTVRVIEGAQYGGSFMLSE